MRPASVSIGWDRYNRRAGERVRVALPAYPARAARGPAGDALAHLTRALRGAVYRWRSKPDRRVAMAAGGARVLERFRAALAAVQSGPAHRSAQGVSALVALMRDFAGAIERRRAGAFERAHEGLLRFADWLGGETTHAPDALPSMASHRARSAAELAA